jgi:putative ABC transport system permease protein
VSLFSSVASWYRAIVRSSKVAIEVEEEVSFHIQTHADSLVASGLSEEEAMHQAKAAFGPVSTQKEKYLTAIGLGPFHEISGDLRFGLRSLLHTPLVSVVAALSLALGIGGTVTVFSVIYDAMLHPYPYDHPERIVQIRIVSPNRPGAAAQFGILQHLSGQQLRQLRSLPGIEDVIGMQTANLTITGNAVPEAPFVTRVTGNSFHFLGIPALLGRMISPSDAPDGKDPQPVAVISYIFWQSHFSGDPDVVGKSIQLDHVDYHILGVIPPRYRWMDQDIFIPLKLQSDLNYGHLVKIKPGISVPTITAQLTSLYQQFQQESPNEFPPRFRLHVTNILEGYAFQLHSMLYLLFAAVLLLLLIACANVSILLLARGSARRHEFAIRSALGASRYRIARQLLVESLLLSVIGTTIGVLIAYGSIGVIAAALPQAFAPEAEFHINVPILLFSMGLSIAIGLLFGSLPAFSLAHTQPQTAIQSGSTKLVGEAQSKHAHNLLIAGQIALTLLLLTSAAAAISGFVHMMDAPLGFNSKNVLALPVILKENTYTSREKRIAYFRRVEQSLSQVAGVSTISLSIDAVPPRSGEFAAVEILGNSDSQKKNANVSFVDTNYFRTLQIPLLQGRLWTESEINHAAGLVLINQAFAKRYFSNSDAIGHSLRIPSLVNNPPDVLAATGSDSWLQVIGVVADSANSGLEDPPAPAIYLSYTLLTYRGIQTLIRTELPSLSLLPAIRRQLATIDPDQAVPKQTVDIETYLQNQSEWRRGRLVSVLFSIFACIALVLAAVGLYSVAGYRVAQRTSEFGIRMAFGARPRHVLWIAILSSATSVCLGIVCGVALTLTLRKPLAGWVPHFGQDYGMLAEVSLLMLIVVFTATLIPALRAAFIAPMKVLRHE